MSLPGESRGQRRAAVNGGAEALHMTERLNRSSGPGKLRLTSVTAVVWLFHLFFILKEEKKKSQCNQSHCLEKHIISFWGCRSKLAPFSRVIIICLIRVWYTEGKRWTIEGSGHTSLYIFFYAIAWQGLYVVCSFIYNNYEALPCSWK